MDAWPLSSPIPIPTNVSSTLEELDLATGHFHPVLEYGYRQAIGGLIGMSAPAEFNTLTRKSSLLDLEPHRDLFVPAADFPSDCSDTSYYHRSRRPSSDDRMFDDLDVLSAAQVLLDTKQHQRYTFESADSTILECNKTDLELEVYPVLIEMTDDLMLDVMCKDDAFVSIAPPISLPDASNETSAFGTKRKGSGSHGVTRDRRSNSLNAIPSICIDPLSLAMDEAHRRDMWNKQLAEELELANIASPKTASLHRFNPSPSHSSALSDDSIHRKCDFCAATKTPMWRHGPKVYPTLCNKCGVKHMRGRLI